MELRCDAVPRRTGTASLLVDEYDDWSRLWWIRLDGRARLVDNTAEAERAIGSLMCKYPQYRDEPPSGPVLAVDVQRWVGWSATSNRFG
jgi:PPOX class probable F420-dependent enzyme